MKVLLVFVALVSSAAQANSDFFDFGSLVSETTCRAHDCLKNGWVVNDRGVQQDVFCHDRDCANEGWFYSTPTNRFSIECAGDGCFKDGWVQRIYPTGRIVEMTECYNHDCLTNGWQSRRPGRFYETYCTEGDCTRKGWEIHTPGAPIAKATCRREGCFVGGWTIEVR